MSGKLDWGKNSRQRKAIENGRESVDGSWASPGIGKPVRQVVHSKGQAVVRRGSKSSPRPTTIQVLILAGDAAGLKVRQRALQRKFHAAPIQSTTEKPRPRKLKARTKSKAKRRAPARAHSLNANKKSADSSMRGIGTTEVKLPSAKALRGAQATQAAGARQMAAAVARNVVPRVPERGEVAVFRQRHARAPEVEVRTTTGRRIRIETVSIRPTKSKRPGA